jgi:hypothetical protein
LDAGRWALFPASVTARHQSRSDSPSPASFMAITAQSDNLWFGHSIIYLYVAGFSSFSLIWWDS